VQRTEQQDLIYMLEKPELAIATTSVCPAGSASRQGSPLTCHKSDCRDTVRQPETGLPPMLTANLVT
jgi:hypothetical protein